MCHSAARDGPVVLDRQWEPAALFACLVLLPSLLWRVLGLRICFRRSCGLESVLVGHVVIGMFSLAVRLWVCYIRGYGSCGHGSAFAGPAAMGLHLSVHDPVALGLFRCSCGHKFILVGHVTMDLFSWVLSCDYGSVFVGPMTMGQLSWALWVWVWFGEYVTIALYCGANCDYESVFVGMSTGLFRWILWLWTCTHGSLSMGLFWW